MAVLSGSERLFYGGITVMTAAALLSLLCVAVFTFTGKKLRKKLEQEYGQIPHKSA